MAWDFFAGRSSTLAAVLAFVSLFWSPATTQAVQKKDTEPKKMTVQEFLDKADQLEQQRNFPGLMTALDEGIRLYPKEPKLYIRRGRFHQTYIGPRNDFQKRAENDFSKAIELDPASHQAWGTRGFFRMNTGHAKSAIEDFTEALKRSPKSGSYVTGYHINRSLCYHRTNEYEKANADNRYVVDLIEGKNVSVKKLNKDERNALTLAYTNNVPVLLSLEKFKEAMAFGDKAAELAENYADARYFKGCAYLAYADRRNRFGNELDTALKEFDATAELSPGFWEVYVKRGRAYHLKQDFINAQADYNLAFTNNRFAGSRINEFLAYNYPATLEELGRFADAISVVKVAILQYPDEPRWKRLHAELEMRNGAIDDAKKILTEAVNKFPDDIDLRGTLGLTYFRAGEQKMADQHFGPMLRNLNSRIRAEPKNTTLLEYKGYLGRVTNRYQGAIRDFRKAITLDPTNWRAMNGLAWTMAKYPEASSDDLAEALRFAQKACKITNEKSSDCLDTRACLEARLGQFDKAVATAELAASHALNRKRQPLLHHIADFRNSQPARQMVDAHFSDSVSVDLHYTPVQNFHCVKDPKQPKQDTRQILDRYKDAVVVLKSDDMVGTGMIIDPSGYILTCAHVLPRIGDVEVESYSKDSEGNEVARKSTAEVVVMDLRNDLAIVKTKETLSSPAVVIARDPKLEAGDFTLCVGNPGAGQKVLGRTPYPGVVAQSNVKIEGRDYLQMTNGTQQGCSGGPVFNEYGQVVGVLVQVAGRQIAFAVPLKEIQRFLGLKPKAN